MNATINILAQAAKSESGSGNLIREPYRHDGSHVCCLLGNTYPPAAKTAQGSLQLNKPLSKKVTRSLPSVAFTLP